MYTKKIDIRKKNDGFTVSVKVNDGVTVVTKLTDAEIQQLVADIKKLDNAV